MRSSFRRAPLARAEAAPPSQCPSTLEMAPHPSQRQIGGRVSPSSFARPKRAARARAPLGKPPRRWGSHGRPTVSMLDSEILKCLTGGVVATACSPPDPHQIWVALPTRKRVSACAYVLARTRRGTHARICPKGMHVRLAAVSRRLALRQRLRESGGLREERLGRLCVFPLTANMH